MSANEWGATNARIEDRDYCHREEKVTIWADETCTSCGRIWGYE